MEMKSGSVVRLKSGGPEMTVELYREAEGDNNVADVLWYDGDDKTFRRATIISFALEVLQS